MAKFALIQLALLSFVSSGLTLTMNDLLGLGYLRQSIPEEPRVVEVIRWRQTVCLTPAPGVLPCMVNLENSQPSHHGYEQYSHGSSYQSKNHLPEEEKPAEDDHLLRTLTKDDSAPDSSSLESIEEDLLTSRKRSTRATESPKLFSPRVMKFLQLENLGPSTLGESIQESTPRRGRYLVLGPGMARNAPKRQTVYVTKVVDSPVVATLVATTCLPDIGIPLCDEIQHSQHNPGAGSHHENQQNHGGSHYENQQNHGGSHYENQQNHGGSHYENQQNHGGSHYGNQQNHGGSHYENQQNHGGSHYGNQQNHGGSHYEHQQNYGGSHYQHPGPQNVGYPPLATHRPPIYGDVTPSPTSNPNNPNGQHQSTTAPNIIQNIADFLNPTRPNIVQASDPPELKPVVVYQQAPPPGIFDGINAFLMPNGSWFGIFNRPANNSSQNGGGFLGLPGIPQLRPPPEVPTLQQFLYRPENEISGPSNILNIFNLTNNQNHYPGAGPPTQSPGIFGGLFASPTRPEGANYYTTPTTTTTTTTTTTPQPSILDGINNIFRPTARPLVIESPDHKPIVVERPIYVAELPVIPGIFDIFGTQNNRPVQLNGNQETQVIKDPVYVLQRPNQAPQIFGIGLPNIFGTPSSTPTRTASDSAAYPNPPRAIPDVAVDSEVVVEADSSPDSQPLENTKSAAHPEPESYAETLAPVQTSAPSSFYAGSNSQTPAAPTLETNLEENDLLEESLTEIVHAEGGPGTIGIAEEVEDVVEDVVQTKKLTEDQDQLEYKNIESVGIKERVDNEA